MTDQTLPPVKAPAVRSVDDEPASVGDAVVPSVEDWQLAADHGAERRAEHRFADPPFQPPSARIARSLLDEFVAWTRAGLPNEACGLLAAPLTAEDGGIPTRFLGMHNVAASPYRYLIDPEEQLRVMLDIDDLDEVVWGICHSHVASPPEPSATDVGLAAYPDALYLICSLAGPSPVVRAWSIRDGAVSEIVLEPV
jgi:[CysO sulfur-carrier protein]-S-L-cysteine hydrolase